MVQEVVSLKSQLQLDVLGDGSVFENRKIKLAEIRAYQGISPLVTEMSCARNARICKAIAARRGVSARNGEGRKVEVAARIMRIVMDRSNNVRPAEEFAATIVIILKEVINLEGLAGLYADDSVQAPAICNPLPTAFSIRELIDKIPRKAIANVKVRISSIRTNGSSAVVRLRGVRHEIFTIAGVVNRVRPYIVQG